MSDKYVTGRCFCGAVKFKAAGKPYWVGHCHCHSCRKSTGAPIVTFVGFKKDQVEFTGHPRKTHHSPPNVSRSFCGECGTPLAWEGVDYEPERGEIIELYISTLDDPDRFTPTNHLWYSERISWFEVDDDLPRYHGFDFNSEIIS